MSKTTSGGPAFPRQGYAHPSAQLEVSERTHLMTDPQQGMSLRDYFAGQYIAGAFGNVYPDDEPAVAEKAYRLADAMLAHRSKA